jgi:hypothetical protein
LRIYGVLLRNDEIKEDDMGSACSMCRGEDIGVCSFGG